MFFKIPRVLGCFSRDWMIVCVWGRPASDDPGMMASNKDHTDGSENRPGDAHTYTHALFDTHEGKKCICAESVVIDLWVEILSLNPCPTRSIGHLYYNQRH